MVKDKSYRVDSLDQLGKDYMYIVTPIDCPPNDNILLVANGWVLYWW